MSVMSAPPSFETLVEDHSQEIFAYLWRMTQNTQDAEDCLQETFLRAYKAYSRLSHHDYLRAWLYKIATNVANTHLKRGQREKKNTEILDEQIADGQYSVGRQVEMKLTLTSLQHAVDDLPEKQRAALMMYRYHDMDYAEIANALDCSQDSARANVYQATKKLREHFAAEEERYE